MLSEDRPLTPVMQQYYDIKKDFPEPIVFFQLGDFYELFFEDALRGSKLLNLTMTHRGNIPMAGIPMHTIEGYVKKLLALGLCAVVCDQVGMPGETKGPMERAVRRVYTPGTVYESEFVDSQRSNYLACFEKSSKQNMALAWIDLCEGIIYWTEGSEKKVMEELLQLEPKEVIGWTKLGSEGDSLKTKYTLIEQWHWNSLESAPYMEKAFRNSGGERDPDASHSCWATIGALVRYVMGHLRDSQIFCGIKRADYTRNLYIDRQTRLHLEIEHAQHEDSLSLFDVLHHTKTAGGTRLLRKWLAEPTRSIDILNGRADTIGYWNKNISIMSNVREDLELITDLERLASKICTKRIRAKEAIMLKESARSIIHLNSLLKNSSLSSQANDFEERLIQFIEKWLIEEPANSIRDGSVINPQVCASYAEQLDLLNNHSDILEQYAREQESLYAISIKSGSNNLQGFFLEVSKSLSEKVPDCFKRIQTLKHCERYQTPELKRIESKILLARSNLSSAQSKLWEQFLEELTVFEPELRTLAQRISFIDVTQSLAFAAQRSDYTRPQWSDKSGIEIEGGRHPVLELASLKGFIANDCKMDAHERLWILTGPNMGGKSTFMRQVALIVFMAHIGSWVPAAKVVLGDTDQIFTRIGAQDNLSQGQSTFMVELTETARILRQATDHSLVLIDEMGRGTSTYDGLALAKATAEYLHNHNQSLCLFSTHYHELQTLAANHLGMANYCFQGTISQKEITFPYTIEKGAVAESFGLYVAQRAGLPPALLERAWEIHKDLAEVPAPASPPAVSCTIASVFDDGPLHWDLDQLSPRELWLRLSQWQAANVGLENLERKD